MREDIADAVAHMLDDKVERLVPMSGGYTSSRTFRVVLVGGEEVFVKVATDEDGVAANGHEATVLAMLPVSLGPALIGVSEDRRVLVTEYVADAEWRSALDVDVLADLWETIDRIGALRGDERLQLAFQGSGRELWSVPLADARFAEAVGVATEWLDAHGSALIEASRAADTSGDRMLHGDLAPGNWCRIDGAWRFVDWAGAYRGSPLVDHAIASIRLSRMRDGIVASPRVSDHGELVAFVAGRFAAELLDVDWSVAPPSARHDRIADIRAGLRLSAEMLGLPPP